MNIDEIRAEIDWAFSPISSTVTWIRANGKPEYSGKVPNVFINYRTAARILVDRAYEAGKHDAQMAIRGMIPTCEEEYKRGYNDAAKDPEAWELEGFKLEDKFRCCKDHDVTVEGFIVCDYGALLVDDDWDNHPVKDCEKVTPDSWEKIQEDLFHRFTNEGYKAFDAEEVASGFIARAKKLAEVD